ncbi:MAG TPA: AAA family ATPase, partial [Allocoleopsis sp.]
KTRLVQRGFSDIENVEIMFGASIYNLSTIRKKIEEEKIEFLIIDALISLAAGKNLNDTDCSSFLYAIKNIASDYGIPILLIHHCNKSGDAANKTSLSRIANSYAIAASASCAFILNYGNDPLSRERILTVAGSRHHANQTSWKLELILEDNSWEYFGECDKQGVILDNQESRQEVKNLEQKIINVLSQRKAKFYPIPQICELLDLEYGAGSYSESSIRKCCPSLVASGQLVRVQLSGKKAYHYAINTDKENLSVTANETQDIMSDPSDLENSKRISHNGSVNSNQDIVIDTATDPSDPFVEKDHLSEGKPERLDKVTLCENGEDNEQTYRFKIGDTVYNEDGSIDNTFKEEDRQIRKDQYLEGEIVFISDSNYYGGAIIQGKKFKRRGASGTWEYECLCIDNGKILETPLTHIYSEYAWNNGLIPEKEDIECLKS